MKSARGLFSLPNFSRKAVAIGALLLSAFGAVAPARGATHNCLTDLADVLSTAPAAESRPGSAHPAHVPLSLSDPLFAKVNGSRKVQWFRERYRVFDGINEADNARYIALAHGPGGHVPGRLYFEVENSILKQLNDSVIGDKDVVTSIGNAYKEMLLRNLQASSLLRKHMIGMYSDFKSMRFVSDSAAPEIAVEFQRIYAMTSQTFARTLEASPLRYLHGRGHGIARAPGSWHLAGVGASADEASAAARSARHRFDPARPLTTMQDFATARTHLGERLRAAEGLRDSLQRGLRGHEGILVPARPGSPKQVLSEPALELMRKVTATEYAEYVRQVRDKFRRRFGVELGEDQVSDLRDYVAIADGLSASIVQAKRVVIDLGQAEHGVVSVDFAGQGARNLRETMAALAEAPAGDAGAAVREARAAEQRATQGMRRMNAEFDGAVQGLWGRDAGRKVLFSGDDGIFMPGQAVTSEQKAALVGRLAATDQPAGYRVTFLPRAFADTGAVIPAAQRSRLIVSAEGVEKGLRGALDGSVPLARLQRMGIGVDLVPNAKGGGVVNLILGGEVDAAMLAQVRAKASVALPGGYRLGEVTHVPRPGSSAPGTGPIAPRAPPAAPVAPAPGAAREGRPAFDLASRPRGGEPVTREERKVLVQRYPVTVEQHNASPNVASPIGDSTVLYLHGTDASGLGKSGITFWSTQPPGGEAPYIFRATVKELKGEGAMLRIDDLSGGQRPGAVSLAAINNKPWAKVPGVRVHRQGDGRMLASGEPASSAQPPQAAPPQAPPPPPAPANPWPAGKARKPPVEINYSHYVPVAELRRPLVGKSSVILDSNASIAVELERKNASLPADRRVPLPRQRQEVVNRLRAIPNVDLRVPDQVVVEAEWASHVTGGWANTGVGASGVPLGVTRDSAEYTSVIRILENNNVGSGKGGMDRQIVADALFARAEPGEMPTLVTADKGVYNGMYRAMGASNVGVQRGGQDFVFTVMDSSGTRRSIRVIPISGE